MKHLQIICLIIFISSSANAIYMVDDTIGEDSELSKTKFNLSQVDNPPKFKHTYGLDFVQWFSMQLNSVDHLPSICKFEGTANFEFCITGEGIVEDITCDRDDLEKDCYDLIKYTIKKSESLWIGGTNKGKPVKVKMSFPLRMKNE